MCYTYIVIILTIEKVFMHRSTTSITRTHRTEIQEDAIRRECAAPPTRTPPLTYLVWRRTRSRCHGCHILTYCYSCRAVRVRTYNTHSRASAKVCIYTCPAYIIHARSYARSNDPNET